MLVVCNGAYKSGSTWLTQIISSHGKWSSIPKEYSVGGWANPSIRDDQYDNYFERKPYLSQDMYCKQHWERDSKYLDLLTMESIRVLSMNRDIKDVLVSRYYHDLRMGVTKADNIEDYYFKENGDIKVSKYIDYQLFWHNPAVGTQPFMCYYEELKKNFETHVIQLFEYLDINLTYSEAESLKNKTEFNKNKNVGEGKFFRKGIVGDWKNHLSEEILSDLSVRCESKKYIYC